jgi:intracellular multiplication protein IcmJ
MYELRLAVNLVGWRTFVRRKRDPAFLPVSQRVFERDAYTCQYCGFQARSYQEVVNIDGRYTNNQFNNLITACCFCSQCLFLQTVGLDEMGGGQLVYLPEMSQADLNSFCHVLFCAIGNNTSYQDSAQAIYRSFKFRSQLIENKLGSGTSHPAVMGQVLIEHQGRSPERKMNILKDLRLLPSYTKFNVQLEAWAAAALEELGTKPDAAPLEELE